MDSKNNKSLKVNENSNIRELLSKLTKFVKENLALFIIVPTVVGGIWQLASLLNIGTAYVRFFSAKQLLSDGLLALLMLSIIFIGPVSVFFTAKAFNDALWSNKTKLNFYFSIVVFSALTYLLGEVIIVFFNDEFPLLYPKGSGKFIILFVTILPMVLFFTTSGLKITEIMKNHELNGTYEEKGFWKKIKMFFYKSLLLAIGLTWFIIIATSIPISLTIYTNTVVSVDSYSKPKNLKNIKNVDRVIESEYGIDPKTIEISYFNDTYIFLKSFKISKDSISKLKSTKKLPYDVIILKIDDLFETKNRRDNLHNDLEKR